MELLTSLHSTDDAYRLEYCFSDRLLAAFMRARTRDWGGRTIQNVSFSPLWFGGPTGGSRGLAERMVDAPLPVERVSVLPGRCWPASRKSSTLDAEGEFEAVSKLLAALLKPPMGEDSPERLQRYIEFSESSRVYRDALRRYNQEFNSPDKTIYRPDFSWQRRAAGRSRLRRAKIKVPSHPPRQTGPPFAQLSDPVRHRSPGSSRSTATGYRRIGV